MQVPGTHEANAQAHIRAHKALLHTTRRSSIGTQGVVANSLNTRVTHKGSSAQALERLEIEIERIWWC